MLKVMEHLLSLDCSLLLFPLRVMLYLLSSALIATSNHGCLPHRLAPMVIT
jgi:hypothetical protein